MAAWASKVFLVLRSLTTQNEHLEWFPTQQSGRELSEVKVSPVVSCHKRPTIKNETTQPESHLLRSCHRRCSGRKSTTTADRHQMDPRRIQPREPRQIKKGTRRVLAVACGVLLPNLRREPKKGKERLEISLTHKLIKGTSVSHRELTAASKTQTVKSRQVHD